MSDLARKMVTAYGMSDKLGAVSFDSGHDEVFIGRSMAQAKTYSEEVAAQIDSEVKAIIDQGYRRCQEILEAHRAQMGSSTPGPPRAGKWSSRPPAPWER